MKFCFYGPPASGKSTIIRKLREAGCPAYDLELLPDTQSRELALQMADNCFIGGADTRPQAAPDRCNVLLLVADPDTYRERRRARDAEYPEKAAQPAQDYEAWYDGPWNHVLDVDDDIQRVIARI